MNNPNISQLNILFYLSTCETCHNFRIKCQRYNLLSNFELKCIDYNKDYYVQRGLKKVPSIVLKGTTSIIDGSDCFKWLDQMIVSMEENNQKLLQDSYNNPYNQNNNYHNKARPPPLIKNNQSNNKKTVLDGFNDMEMNSISDKYAHESEKNNDSFKQNFQLKNMNSEIFTPPIEKTKLKENKQSDLTKRLTLQRNNDTNNFKKKIEKEHIRIMNEK